MKKFLVKIAYNKTIICMAYLFLIINALFVVAPAGYGILAALLVFFWGVNLTATIMFYKQPTELDINLWLK